MDAHFRLVARDAKNSRELRADRFAEMENNVVKMEDKIRMEKELLRRLSETMKIPLCFFTG